MLDGLANGSRTEQAAAMPSHNKRPLIFSGERSCCFCGLFAFGFCKQHVHVFRAGIPIAGGGLVLRHQAVGKAHAKAARLAELRDVLRR